MPDRRNMNFRQENRFLLFIKAFIALYVLYTDKFNDFIFFCILMVSLKILMLLSQPDSSNANGEQSFLPS